MPLALRQNFILKWKDLNGGTRTQTMTTLDNATPTFGACSGLQTALVNASSCGLMFAAMQPMLNVNATPGSGPYPTAQDQLQLIFRTGVGTTGRLNVPGPIAELFLDGTDRVDFENAKVEAIVSAVFSSICDPYGNPFVKAVSGKRLKIEIPLASGG